MFTKKATNKQSRKIQEEKKRIANKVRNLNLVEVKELKTPIGTNYLLVMGDMNVRTYLNKDDAYAVASYMNQVSLAIILKYVFG